MKFSFETKGFFVVANEDGVKLHAEAGDTKIYGDASWDEVHRAYVKVHSSVPRKVVRAMREQPGEVV